MSRVMTKTYAKHNAFATSMDLNQSAHLRRLAHPHSLIRIHVVRYIKFLDL
jgi:hypothetical protein